MLMLNIYFIALAVCQSSNCISILIKSESIILYNSNCIVLGYSIVFSMVRCGKFEYNLILFALIFD